METGIYRGIDWWRNSLGYFWATNVVMKPVGPFATEDELYASIDVFKRKG